MVLMNMFCQSVGWLLVVSVFGWVPFSGNFGLVFSVSALCGLVWSLIPRKKASWAWLWLGAPMARVALAYKIRKIKWLGAVDRWITAKTGVSPLNCLSGGVVWTWEHVDLLSFGMVAWSVYFYLKRKGKLEAAAPADVSIWQMICSGLRVGAITAGLVDLGRGITHKTYEKVSIVADVFHALAQVFGGASKSSFYDVDEDRFNELPVEDDLPWFQMVVSRVWAAKKRVTKQAAKLLKRHGFNMACFALAVFTGVFLYLWFNQRKLLEDYLEGNHRKGGNANKGKNVRGRKAPRSNGKRVVSGKKNFWKYYDGADVNNIIEVFYNGEPVSVGRIEVNKALEPGKWVVVHKEGNVVWEDEFDVIGNDKNFVSRQKHFEGATLESMAWFPDDAHGRDCRHGPKCRKEQTYSRLCMVQCSDDCKHTTECCDYWWAVVEDAIKNDPVLSQFVVPITDVQGKVVDLLAQRDLAKSNFMEDAQNTPRVVKAPFKPLPPVPKKQGVFVPGPGTPPALPPKPERRRETLSTEPVEITCSQCGRKFNTPQGRDQHMRDNCKAKKEALVPQAPVWDVVSFVPFIGCLMTEQCSCSHQGSSRRVCDHYVSQCFGAWNGIWCNVHALAKAKFFKFGDKYHEKTKVWYQGLENKDLAICATYDGCPKLPKKKFDTPCESQKVGLVNQKLAVATGSVTSVAEVGAQGEQARATYTSEEGDCGGPVLNTNNNVVGMHFSAGRPKVDNLFIPVTPALLKLQPKN